jgi:16S rRNA processing protein RimM
MVLEDNWEYKGRRVFKFAGVDSIASAEGYVGCWVVIPSDQAVPLPKGTYYDHDLIGCSVKDTHGNRLGIVDDVLHIAGTSQLVVKDLNREYLIPAVEGICLRISVEGKQILVDPPEGLMDLDK